MTCRMKCFCAVSSSGAMQFAMSVLLEETAFGGHANLWLADPSIADFSNISRLPGASRLLKLDCAV